MTRYELLDRIGVGGMAEIFRGKAVAAGGFEKPVAIKRILPHLSQDKRFVELLIAEAKVLSLLKHRNIVQIFDVGLGDDGQYFLVMEYVDGKDLGAVQRGNEALRRRIPFDLALHVGAEICEALEHAHSARAPDGKPMSLVHRDLSPSNVLLSRAGEVKLTDFGIAKRAESEHTGSGAVRGKFAYISPEQARNEHVEPRSDVFSVGILVWEMVTGQRLFSKLGDLESLRAVREAAVQRPTAADPKLPDAIDKLLLGALNKDPKRRPTAGQFGEQLRSLRYSLEDSGGDPATQLAQMIDDAEQHERESSEKIPLPKLHPFSRLPGPPPVREIKTGFEHEGTEATVIRIRTAAEFSLLADESIVAARQVIDRFEEEETRLAALSSEQMRFLRGAPRELDDEIDPPRFDPLSRVSPLPHNHFAADEATRVVAPTNRRTPVPERVKPAPTNPPPLPGMTAPRRPGASLPPPLPGLPAPVAHPMPAPPVADYGPGPVMQMNPMPPTPMPPIGQPYMGQPYMGQPYMGQPMHHDPSHAMMARPLSGHAPGPRRQGSALQPWMLIVGAIIMAAAAFLLTRLVIRG